MKSILAENIKAFLSNIREDFSHGRNYLHYLLILAAILMPVLNLLRVVSDEWLFRVMLPTLSLLLASAVSNSRLLRDLNVRREQPLVVIHEHWSGEIYEIVASARKSIVILTSWAIDSPTLGDKIHDACKRARDEINVDVFMLDPDRPFGAQRYGEVFESDSEPQNLEDWSQQYKARFESACKDFTRKLRKPPNARLKLYKYPLMPALKLYIIDDEKFFFSWLTADGGSTNNVCFELSSLSNDPNILYAKEKFRAHIEALREKSTII